MAKDKISIKAIINASIDNIWKLWTEPEHIKKWNMASDDWHTTESLNDLRIGGKFSSRMEAKDGSMGFDFYGIYDDVINHQYIAYTLGNGRKVEFNFKDKSGKTEVVQMFEAESENSIEMQKEGWQSILDNFKVYAEINNK